MRLQLLINSPYLQQLTASYSVLMYVQIIGSSHEQERVMTTINLVKSVLELVLSYQPLPIRALGL